MHHRKPNHLRTVGPREDRFFINDSSHEKSSRGEQYVSRDRPRFWKADWRVVLHVQNDAMVSAAESSSKADRSFIMH